MVEPVVRFLNFLVMADSIDKVMGGVEFCDGGEGVEIDGINIAELADSLVSGYFENYSEARVARFTEVNGCLERAFKELEKISRSSNSVIVRNGEGKVIGIGGVEKINCPDFRGRPVVMFTKLTVLPEVRSQGIFKEIVRRLREKAKIGWPNGVFVVMTRNPIVKKRFLAEGFFSIGARNIESLTSNGSVSVLDSRTAGRMREIEAEGWDVFCSGVPVKEIPDVKLAEENSSGSVGRVCSGILKRIRRLVT